MIMEKITDIQGIRDYRNEIVHIEGIYRQIDVRMNREHPKTLYLGHVAICLNDATSVLIYPPYDPRALREYSEITKFENSVVILKCKVLPYVPQNFPVEIAMLRTPCIIDLFSLDFAKQI